jgi:DNA-binding response OmpR family regulator
MSDKSRFEICAKLKFDPVTADVSIILLSALDDVKNKAKGSKIDGIDCVSKPLHGEEGLARVRAHLRIGETNRAIAREHQKAME